MFLVMKLHVRRGPSGYVVPILRSRTPLLAQFLGSLNVFSAGPYVNALRVRRRFHR